MRISTIEHLVERINHANATHGKFSCPQHVLDAARIELMEAESAAKHLTFKEFRSELLDTAVICIRAAEQLVVD